jgi:outer membrane protein assembly factor BamA
MGAEIGSYIYALGANLHVLDDRLRLQAGAVDVDTRYRYNGIGNDEPAGNLENNVRQRGPAYFAQSSLKLWKSLYSGISVMSGGIETRFRAGAPILPGDLFAGPEFDIAARTVPMAIDARNQEQFPGNGWFVDGCAEFYRESMGGDTDAETYRLAIDHYRPIRQQDVLASRLAVRTVDGDVPFFLLSTFGASADVRGCPSGRYRGRAMYAMQSEYRLPRNDNWIVATFAGFGEVADCFSAFGEIILPAGGVGKRFVLSRKHTVSRSGIRRQ